MRNIIDFDFPELKPMSTGAWKLGDFGPAKTEVAEMCGIKNYNVQIPSFFGMMSAVLNKEGNKLYFFGFTKKVDIMEWISEEDMKKLLEDRDPADAPSCSYFEPNPDVPRRIIWLSGANFNLFTTLESPNYSNSNSSNLLL